jgi:hypothetical protein
MLHTIRWIGTGTVDHRRLYNKHTKSARGINGKTSKVDSPGSELQTTALRPLITSEIDVGTMDMVITSTKISPNELSR